MFSCDICGFSCMDESHYFEDDKILRCLFCKMRYDWLGLRNMKNPNPVLMQRVENWIQLEKQQE